MEPVDYIVRGVVTVTVLYAFLLVYRGLRALWRGARKISTTTIARTAGKASAVAERKAASIAAAFKQGRDS